MRERSRDLDVAVVQDESDGPEQLYKTATRSAVGRDCAGVGIVCLFVDHFYTVKRIVTLGLWQRCNDCKENSNVRAVAAV